MSTSPEAARPRRRWVRRLLIGLNIFIATCILLTASAFGYYRVTEGKIDRISFGPSFLRPEDAKENPGQVMNVLLVGSDSRADIKGKDAKSFGSDDKVGGQRSDTMMILHIDPAQTKAAMLSVPRDLYVDIAESKGKGRINTAFEGGPERLIKTITQNLGIPIDHYMQVDFNGFRGAVDAMGGVKVYFEGPARDRITGLNVPKGGCVTLSPDQALAYVRSRQYSYYEGGRWHTDPSGDIGRISRQQDFMRRVIKKAASQRDPRKVLGLIDAGARNLTVDEGFDLIGDGKKLATRFNSLDPNEVEMISLPVVDAVVGDAAVLRLKQPEAQEVINRFNNVTPEPEQAAEQPSTNVLANTVRVRVLNGSGVGGLATQVSKDLKTTGVGIAGTGDADSYKYIRSVIRYAPGQKDKALFLNTLLKKQAKLEVDATIKGIDAVLIAGGDWAGVNPQPGAAPTSSTASTAKPAEEPKPKGASPADQC